MTCLDKQTAKVGLRVQNLWGELGTICWVGELKAGPSGFFCGVEYDMARNVLTRTDGMSSGQRYFEVGKPKTGEFVKAKYLMKEIWPELAAKLQPAFPMLDEERLMKFLLARKCNEKHAVEMIKKHLQWVATAKPDPDERIPRSISQFYPIGWQGEDLEGNLLVVERPGNGGKASPKEILKIYGVEQLSRWHITVMEGIKRQLRETNKVRATFLIDLSNLGEVSRRTLTWARAISSIDQDNYPETVKRIIIINAPGFFSSVWSAVKLFIDERTREKVLLFGTTGYRDTLLQYIDEKFLPPFAGGTCEEYLSRGGCIGTPIDDGQSPNDLREVASMDEDSAIAFEGKMDTPVLPSQDEDELVEETSAKLVVS